MPAWDSPFGNPYNKINMQSRHTSNPGWAGLLLDHICMYVICLVKCSEFLHSISFHQLLLASLQVSILLLDFLQSTREPILVGQHYTFEYTLLVCFHTLTTSYRFPLGEVTTAYFFHTYVVLKHINGFRN